MIVKKKIENDLEKQNEKLEESIENSEKKRKFKISDRLYSVVRIIALAAAAGVLVYTSYSLTESYLNYKEDEAKYASINEMFVQTEDTDTEQTDTEDEGNMDYSATITTWTWDYQAMLEYNDEAKGYIKLDGTRIQYPIVEHSDNEFYLKKGSDKVSNGAGSIFIDYRTAGLEGNMCILYGHNMLDGSMFKGLMDFRNSDFCKKHPTFDIYVGYKHYIYYVFSTFTTKDDNEEIYQFGFESDSDFQNWINRVYNKSSYRFDCEKPDVSDKIIMCSTCVDDNGNRQIVCMYRGEEVVD
jgi:sortase B